MPELVAPPVEPAGKLTQHQKIVAYMCQNHTKEWWLASDFMKPEMGHLFVGYEATARIAELIGDNPDMFETKRDGRFRAFRIKFETGKDWYKGISPKLQLMIKRYYKG